MPESIFGVVVNDQLWHHPPHSSHGHDFSCEPTSFLKWLWSDDGNSAASASAASAQGDDLALARNPAWDQHMDALALKRTLQPSMFLKTDAASTAAASDAQPDCHCKCTSGTHGAQDFNASLSASGANALAAAHPGKAVIQVFSDVLGAAPSPNPKVWGPQAWKMLHCLAGTLPDQLSPEVQHSFKNVIEALPQLLPCHPCAENLERHLADMPLDGHLSTRQDVSEWLVNLHNKVNADLGKPQLSMDEALASNNQVCGIASPSTDKVLQSMKQLSLAMAPKPVMASMPVLSGGVALLLSSGASRWASVRRFIPGRQEKQKDGRSKRGSSSGMPLLQLLDHPNPKALKMGMDFL